MFGGMRSLCIVLGLAACLPMAAGQTPPTPGGASQAPAVKKPAPPPPPASAIAVTVNGQSIPEMAVYRAFLNDPASATPEGRREVINHLVDNMLVDQYLYQLKIAVDPKEVEDRFNQIDAEAKKNNQKLTEMLAKMMLNEEDLRKELQGAVRWEKFLAQQATDKALQDLFDKNPTMFNGTQVQARHILLPNKGEASMQQIRSLRAAIEKQVIDEMKAKLPAGADELAIQKERALVLVKSFSAMATKESTCPSKAKGGDLGYFPRIGAMVEPFAKAAFAQRPYEMSQPVETEFGLHLILTTDYRPGREVKFDDVRAFVQEVYGERLREAIVTAYKPRPKIVVNPAP